MTEAILLTVGFSWVQWCCFALPCFILPSERIVSSTGQQSQSKLSTIHVTHITFQGDKRISVNHEYSSVRTKN
jgi:hypothetical protein